MSVTRVESIIEKIEEEIGLFWKVSSKSTFEKSALKLCALGMDDEEIVDFLSTLYRAVGNEYGD